MDGGVAVDTATLLQNSAQVTLTGGIAGRSYRVANHVTLSDGREDVRSITLRVEAR